VCMCVSICVFVVGSVWMALFIATGIMSLIRMCAGVSVGVGVGMYVDVDVGVGVGVVWVWPCVCVCVNRCVCV